MTIKGIWVGYPLFVNKTFTKRTSVIGQRPLDFWQYTLCSLANWWQSIELSSMHIYNFPNCRKSTKLPPILINIHRTFTNLGVTLVLLRAICIDYIHTVLQQIVKVYKTFANIDESLQDPRQLASESLVDFRFHYFIS